FSPSSFASYYYIYLSEDGIHFPDSIQTNSITTVLSGLMTDSLYFVRVRAVNDSSFSNPTEVLAATPSVNDHQVLIVNGFDRKNGTNNFLNYIRQHACAIKNLDWAFSSTSNDAIIAGTISLDEFTIVDWIIGDESTSDETFNFEEQEKVTNYLKNGGNLFITGSEIGWDLSYKGYTADKQFYADYLKAQYIADAPLGQSSNYYAVESLNGEIFDGIAPFNFDDGTNGTYNVDWPDAITTINDSKNCLLYSGVSQSNGVAGIYFDGVFPGGIIPGRLVYLAFPFETIYPEVMRDTVMSRIFDFFESPSPNSIVEEKNLPGKFTLYQNYPNPFNAVTTISYELHKPGFVQLIIINNQGQIIETLVNQQKKQGYHKIVWDASKYSSGLYFIRVIAGTNSEVRKCMLIK
ncbi:fibronectin type III domain-containing protein, partial [Calditrichota bacterium]